MLLLLLGAGISTPEPTDPAVCLTLDERDLDLTLDERDLDLTLPERPDCDD